MKKILFLIPTLGQGGAEKVLVNLVNNMNEDLFDITVMTLFDVGINKQFLKDNIHYKSFMKHQFIGNTWIFKMFSPRFLYKKIVKDKYDIVVSYLEGPTARIVSGCIYPNTKLVSWIHVEQHTKNKASASFRNYKEALECYSRYDQIVCVSEYVKNDFLSIFPLKQSISVIYNTNETSQIQKLANENIDIYIDPNFINLCAVGTLKESKGFDRLIRIVKRLLMDNLNVKLYILGKGPLERKLKNHVDKLHLEKNVIFLGYQVNPYKYLSKMDIFTCASFAEGFSTAATEALVLGLPVVTVSVSGMYEMLGYHDEYGIVTENNEEKLYIGLKKMIENQNLLKKYKRQAKIRGKYFSKENTVKAVEKMLEECV